MILGGDTRNLRISDNTIYFQSKREKKSPTKIYYSDGQSFKILGKYAIPNPDYLCMGVLQAVKV